VGTCLFLTNSIWRGQLSFSGTEFPKILPPISFFAPDNQYGKKFDIASEKLKLFWDKHKIVIDNFSKTLNDE
jgi:hypothetical protein